MNYAQSEAWILAFTNYEKTPGVPYTLASYDLRRMDELLRPLGNPHLAAKTVHITGTKGKGSAAAMIASALTTAGYRTGLYTSPHLITLRERIRIGFRLILRSELASLATEVKPLVERVNRQAKYGELTTFEILTVVTFLYFARQKVAYQVLEVGLGGRLDATNVIPRPEVCVITSISLDHMDALGDTVAKIAAEKAGIIKPGCTAVTAPQPPEALAVIEAAASRAGAPLIRVGTDVTWTAPPPLWRHHERSEGSGGSSATGNISYQRFLVHGRSADYPLRIPLLGAFQQENAAVAVAVLEALAERGARLFTADIARGLKKVKWPGRLQVLGASPLLVVDGAHNSYSTASLVRALRDTFRFQKAVVVAGMSGDKDIPGIVEELARLGGSFIITRAGHPRAAPPERVVAEFARHGAKASVADSVAAALEEALGQAAEKDLILVTGSLFVVGEAIQWVKAAGIPSLGGRG